MKFSDFAKTFEGFVGGTVEGMTWTCVCGSTSTELNEQAAKLALYLHRRHEHTGISGCDKPGHPQNYSHNCEEYLPPSPCHNATTVPHDDHGHCLACGAKVDVRTDKEGS